MGGLMFQPLGRGSDCFDDKTEDSQETKCKKAKHSCDGLTDGARKTCEAQVQGDFKQCMAADKQEDRAEKASKHCKG